MLPPDRLCRERKGVLTVKFSEMQYQRPEPEALKAQLGIVIKYFKR